VPPTANPSSPCKLATGRYLHAEHDDVDDVLRRIHEVRASTTSTRSAEALISGVQGATRWRDGYAAAN
jgi:hypothetical protein